MQFPDSDAIAPVQPGTAPAYDQNNPLVRLLAEAEQAGFAAEREVYLPDSIQHLFPFRRLTLHGPVPPAWQETDVRRQDNKDDFQKQNIADFELGDFWVMRGYASAGTWTGPFVKIAYRATPGTVLGRATGGNPGPHLQLWLRLGQRTVPSYLRLPLNPASGCYEVELWSFPGDPRPLLGPKGQAALDTGLLQARPDLVVGSLADFEGPAIDALRDALNRSRNSWDLYPHAPEHALHPLRPLRLELAFASHDLGAWDSQEGRNHRVEFDMFLRGWKSFLSVGVSPNPHGGVGFLEFRNLASNYFLHERRRREELGDERWRPELGRDLIPGNFDAHTHRPGELGSERVGPKVQSPRRESFMAVDYMDLHILQPSCGIGIHRHRDNQEIFLMLEGRGRMIVGDWAHVPHRDRAFEIRPMVPGDLTLCGTGQLHALFNSTDQECLLFMFGGYD
jgi:mannose-6-phosphate isomerase-like protein (cupin superfamily)